MRPGRIVALIIGVVLLLPGLAFGAGGAVAGLAHLFGRDDDGYFEATLDRVDTETVAITTEEIDLMAEPGAPDWVFDVLDADVRLRVTAASAERDVFVGVAPEADVDAYLRGVAHAEVVDMDDLTAVLRTRTGTDVVGPPVDEVFWDEQASGPGTQELVWEPTAGRWAIVVMNADGTAGVGADVEAGARVPFLGGLALLLLFGGLALTAIAIVLIVFAASGPRTEGDRDGAAASVVPEDAGPEPVPVGPVALDADLDPGLSRWLWLVKWILVIPHMIILVFLWVAFVVLTVVAGVAVLVTGRYPRAIFDFNVGVLRWCWRVYYYAGGGGLGTDRYPPFRLAHDPDYPATLDIAYPERLSRGLVLVKWWLLAIPHYVVLAVIVGGGALGWEVAGDGSGSVETAGMGLLTALALIAGGHLLFTARYPRGLFDLIVGLNRWVYRVVAYAALMTDEYPPFRLDQGGHGVTPPLDPPGPTGPADVRLPEPEPVGSGAPG